MAKYKFVDQKDSVHTLRKVKTFKKDANSPVYKIKNNYIILPQIFVLATNIHILRNT